jgi:hypothetical protein
LSEWLYEAGIPARAALVADGRIVQARIELTATLTVGTVAEGGWSNCSPVDRAG